MTIHQRRQLRLVKALCGLVGCGFLYSWTCGRRVVPPTSPPLCSRSYAADGLEIPRLTLGSARDRQLAAGESHAYHIHLLADHYLHLIAEQHGIDVAVAFFVPDGQCLVEVDSPTGTEGQEPLWVVAPTAGDYHVEVHALDGSSAGQYRLRVNELRPATIEDRHRAAAALAFAEGEQQRSRSEASTLRAAIASYQRALGLLRQAGEASAREAMTLRRLGQTWSALGEVQKANQSFEEALALFQQIDDLVAQARLLNEAGSTFLRLGELKKAEAYYLRALHLARTTESSLSEVTAVNNLGLIYGTLGEFQRALKYYDQALEGWRALDDRAREAATLHNLGMSYCRLGRLRDALDFLGQALALRRSSGNLRGEAATLSAVGWALYLAGDLSRALDAYDESLRLRHTVGDQRGEAATLDRRGAVYWKMGRRQEATRSFHEALDIFRRVGDRLSEAHVQANLGWVYESWARPDEALENLIPSLGFFQEIDDPNGEAYARVGSARAERQRGHLRAAQAHAEAALTLIESVRSDVAIPALRSSYLASRQDYYEFLVELLMQRHELEPGLGYDARALEVSERARARGLLEGLMEARVDLLAGSDPELIESVRSLETEIRNLERRRFDLAAQGLSRAEMVLLGRKLRGLVLEYGNLQGRLRAESNQYRALSPPQALKTEDLQSLLDDETSLLWFALGRERSFLWVVGRRSLASHVLPGRSEIEAAARSLHDLMQRSHLRSVQKQVQLAAKAMSDMVLAPAADHLQARRLVVVSDGALHFVPLAALPLPAGMEPGPNDDVSTPLAANHEVVSIPSASVLHLLRHERTERPSRASHTVAVFADPVFDRNDSRLSLEGAATVAESGGFPTSPSVHGFALGQAAQDVGLAGFDRLVHSRQEAEAILALFPSEERFRALDFEASRQTLFEEAGRHRILHFATHSLLNAEHPQLSGVVLSLVDEGGQPQDGFLQLSDLHRLDLSAELVVLSACRTALGKEVRGEGLVGLTGGFLSSGASRVLVSLWNVDDQATAQLMVRFYHHLVKGHLSPAAALRRAQLSMLEQERWAAPYYWAGFILQGDWESDPAPDPILSSSGL